MKNMTSVYGRMADAFPARKARLEEEFRSRYGHAPACFFSSPGRAEIVGNHTDHNHGKVLVSAISCDILCAAEKREDGIIEIVSEGFRPVRLSVKDRDPQEGERGRSVSFVRGVMRWITDRGFCVGGFSAVTTSNVFRGAGVSSSAAFAVLAAELFNYFYLEHALTPMDKARAAQYAENVYFGKPCGLLDQSGIALGGLNKIDFLHPEDPAVESVPAPAGYSLVMTNTGGSHSNLTEHYAAIRTEMGQVAAFFGKKVLREVTYQNVLENLPTLREKTSDRAVLRAIHFFEENARVDRAAEALKNGVWGSFLACISESGESSLRWLQNCSVPGELSQPMLVALKLSEKVIQDGAFRMMGGGFAGAVLAVCRTGEEERYMREMARVFGRENVFLADLRAVGTTKIL